MSEDRSPKIPGFRFQSSFSHHNLEVDHPMFRQTCGQLQVFHFPGGLGGNESRAAPGRNSGSRFEEMVQQIWDSCVPTTQFFWEPYCHSCFNLADHPGLFCGRVWLSHQTTPYRARFVGSLWTQNSSQLVSTNIAKGQDTVFFEQDWFQVFSPCTMFQPSFFHVFSPFQKPSLGEPEIERLRLLSRDE